MQRLIPDYELRDLTRKRAAANARNTAADAPIKPGRRNQLAQHQRLAAGRLAFVQIAQTFAALAQFDQSDRNERREQRTRPEVLGALAVRVDDATGERIVLSERRREHWPEPAPRTPSYNHARLLETEAIRAGGVRGTLAGWRSRLFT